jgi:hypothetical protein
VSRLFREYLDRQPLERKRQILRAERAYAESRRVEHAPEGGAGDPIEQAFNESMLGYGDSLPAPLDKLPDL